eukprot:TRINITY_DN2513_c0_g1_i1.p1 TRINITY_DN2513_c0_g1~~TRINITY_DN2513_c0_g1_i1.p1  ORF type:complete len:410 (+),score=87.02 TRINITY_DN2513_c0_g1_i1:37-1230(+)
MKLHHCTIFVLFGLILIGVCNAATPSTTTSSNLVCNGQVDIVLLLDGSDSIYPYWDKVTNFTQEILNNFAITDMGTHLSIYQFGTEARKEICLTGTSCVLSGIAEKVSWISGLTRLDRGLSLVRQEFKLNSRSGAKKYVIVLTDGDLDQTGQPQGIAPSWPDECSDTLDEGIEIIMIGVGNDPKGSQLNLCAKRDENDASNTIMGNFTELHTFVGDLSQKTCVVVETSSFNSSGSCPATGWLTPLGCLVLAIVVLKFLWDPPRANNKIALAQIGVCVVGLLQFILFLLAAFTTISLLCIVQAILSGIIIVAGIGLLVWHNKEILEQKYENRTGTSKAGMTAVAAGGVSPAAMAAFRKDKNKATTITTDESYLASTIGSVYSNPLRNQPRSAASASLF